MGHSCCSLMLQPALREGGHTGGTIQGQRTPCHWNTRTQPGRTLFLFPALAQCQRAQDRAVSALREQQVCGGQVEGAPPVSGLCLSAPTMPQLLSLWPKVLPECYSNRILHFEVIVNLLNPARSNHTTSYPLDNEQRLFSFLVPQWNSSFLPAPDWGCD